MKHGWSWALCKTADFACIVHEQAKLTVFIDILEWIGFFHSFWRQIHRLRVCSSHRLLDFFLRALNMRRRFEKVHTCSEFPENKLSQ